MEAEPNPASADVPIPSEIPMGRTRRTRMNSAANAVEAVDNPVRKRRRIDCKDVIQAQNNGMDQENSEQKAGPKRKRRSGKLTELLTMPLDVLFEILSHLMPLDLLRLARTTKDFRKLLMSRSSISIWKHVLWNIPGLPECPPWMNEPTWANLAFSPHCHFCLTHTPNIEWRFRARICGKCSKKYVGEFLFQYLFPNTGYAVDLESVAPCRRGKRQKKAYLIADLLKVNKEINALEGDEARKAYILSRKQNVQDIVSHSTACESWARSQTHDRDLELRQLREERKAAIIRKLEDLGWGQDIASIRYPDSLAQHRLVDRPQRLTDKIWSNIKGPMLEYLALMRQRRLQRELDALVVIRKGVATEVLKAFKKARKLEVNEVMPEPPDFCDFEPVKEIINRPVDVDVVASTFDPILPLLPGLISSWRNNIDGAMAEVVKRFIFLKDNPVSEDYENPEYPCRFEPKKEKLSDEQASQKVKGASTVFVCKKCSPDDDDSSDYWSYYISRQPTQLLFYPQVLTHSCLTRQSLRPLWDLVVHDPSKSLESYGLKERIHWRAPGLLAVNTYASDVAEVVIRHTGLDPTTATSEDMDRLEDRFICLLCPKTSPAQGELNTEGILEYFLYDWRSLVAHLAHFFHSTAASDFEKNLLRLKPNQLSDEMKEAENAHRINTIKEWSCFHCLDTTREKAPTTLEAVKQHISMTHSIEKPVLNGDYFKNFSGPDITSNQFQHSLKVCFIDGNLSVATEHHGSEIDDEDGFAYFDSDAY